MTVKRQTAFEINVFVQREYALWLLSVDKQLITDNILHFDKHA